MIVCPTFKGKQKDSEARLDRMVVKQVIRCDLIRRGCDLVKLRLANRFILTELQSGAIRESLCHHQAGLLGD